ncbi:GIP [Symbiodinium sp. KB8]|nr:GIP [Symbiodinium sp. KB8]
MRRCSASADVQESCCKILKELAAMNAQMREHLLKESALEMVINAMKNHVQHGRVQVQEAGCWVLRELASTVDGNGESLSKGASAVFCSVQALSVAIHEHDVPEVQKAGSAARQRLAVRGFRLSQFQTQLVRPSIVKRRRHFASFCGCTDEHVHADPCTDVKKVWFQIAGREVAVQIRNDQVLVQQGQVFVPMAKYLSTIGLLGGTANGSVTPRGSGSGGGTPRSSVAPAASEAQSPQGATTPRSSTGSRTMPVPASSPKAATPKATPKSSPPKATPPKAAAPASPKPKSQSLAIPNLKAAPTKAKAASPKSGSPIAKVGAAVPKPGAVPAKPGPATPRSNLTPRPPGPGGPSPKPGNPPAASPRTALAKALAAKAQPKPGGYGLAATR